MNMAHVPGELYCRGDQEQISVSLEFAVSDSNPLGTLSATAKELTASALVLLPPPLLPLTPTGGVLTTPHRG
jgi:hypothetical protein